MLFPSIICIKAIASLMYTVLYGTTEISRTDAVWFSSTDVSSDLASSSNMLNGTALIGCFLFHESKCFSIWFFYGTVQIICTTYCQWCTNEWFHLFLSIYSHTTWKKTSCNTSLVLRRSIDNKPCTARLYCFPDSIWSTVADAYTPESMKISRKPTSPQSWSIDKIKQHCVWKPPSRIVWLLNSSGKCHITCFAIQYTCWSIVCTEKDRPSACDISVHFSMTVYARLTYLRVWHLLLEQIQLQCEMTVTQRLMTGILTKKEWQCPVLHIHSVTGSVHGRVDGEVSRHTY